MNLTLKWVKAGSVSIYYVSIFQWQVEICSRDLSPIISEIYNGKPHYGRMTLFVQPTIDDDDDHHHLLNESFGLTQHIIIIVIYIAPINFPTHTARHSLDLIITWTDSNLITETEVINPGLSDHSAVIFSFALPKPPLPRKNISFYRTKSNDNVKFLVMCCLPL